MADDVPLAGHGSLIARLHEQAGAKRWNLPIERFGEALARSAERRFHPTSLDAVPPTRVAGYLESLHVADLALACACAEGSEPAWEEFMTTHRPGLYAAARAIAGSEGRELADTLYADLYGIAERGGRRRPLFDYFHGRSRLSTWLRAVLAQRHVDVVRAARRTESLDIDEAEGAAGTRAARLAAPEPPHEPDRPRLTRAFQQAAADAVAALVPADRLRLSYYYLHDLTLAEIGRLMGEHESSASRKLDRARRAIRDDIERRLRAQGLEDGDLRQCYEWAMADGGWELKSEG